MGGILAILVTIISSCLFLWKGLQLGVLLSCSFLVGLGGFLSSFWGKEGWGGSGNDAEIYWRVLFILGLLASIILPRLIKAIH